LFSFDFSIFSRTLQYIMKLSDWQRTTLFLVVLWLDTSHAFLPRWMKRHLSIKRRQPPVLSRQSEQSSNSNSDNTKENNADTSSSETEWYEAFVFTPSDDLQKALGIGPMPPKSPPPSDLLLNNNHHNRGKAVFGGAFLANLPFFLRNGQGAAQPTATASSQDQALLPDDQLSSTLSGKAMKASNYAPTNETLRAQRFERYDAMTVPELKVELKERGLKISGKKQVLIKRLIMADEEEEEEEEERSSNMMMSSNTDRGVVAKVVSNKVDSKNALPLFSSGVEKGVNRNAIRGAILGTTVAGAVVSKSVAVSSAAGFGAFYVAITHGKAGQACRLLGEIVWDTAQTVLEAIQKVDAPKMMQALVKLAGSSQEFLNTVNTVVADAVEYDERNNVAATDRRAPFMKREKEQEEETTARTEAELALEEARLALEEPRIAEEEAKKAEGARLLEETRLAEQARIAAKEARLAEEAEIAKQETMREQEARRAEEAEIAEEARLAAATALAAEEDKVKEEARLTAERKVKEARLEEEARLAEEARLEEEARLAEEARLEEEARLAEEARLEEEARLAEEARLEEEAKWLESARIAEEIQLDESTEEFEWDDDIDYDGQGALSLAEELGQSDEEEEIDLEALGRAAREAVEAFEQQMSFEEQEKAARRQAWDSAMETGDVPIMQGWNQMTVAQLRSELKARRLPTTGKKAELVAVLEAASEETMNEKDFLFESDDDDELSIDDLDKIGRAAREAAELFNYVDDDDDEPSDEALWKIAQEVERPAESYQSMTVAELKNELKSRGLSVSGKKADLIERLLSSD